MSTNNLQPYEPPFADSDVSAEQLRAILDDARQHYEAQVRRLGGLAQPDAAPRAALTVEQALAQIESVFAEDESCPVVAHECTEGIEQFRMLRWHPLPAGEFVGTTDALLRQRDHLAAMAAKDAEILRLQGLCDDEHKAQQALGRMFNEAADAASALKGKHHSELAAKDARIAFLQEVADSDGSRAVEYLRRARKAEARIAQLEKENFALAAEADAERLRAAYMGLRPHCLEHFPVGTLGRDEPADAALFKADAAMAQQQERPNIDATALPPAAETFMHAAPDLVEMSPEFTDTARAALLWVLWHHQGAISPIGQPLRFALGMGAHDRLSERQIAEARRWAAQTWSTTTDFRRAKSAQTDYEALIAEHMRLVTAYARRAAAPEFWEGGSGEARAAVEASARKLLGIA